MPAPAQLEQYERILPGAAERILKMAEEQFVHRSNLEQRVIQNAIRNSRLGLLFGFIIGIAGLGVVIYCANQPLLAGFVAAINLGGLVGIFV